jgi:Tfp pilus assembly protein PilV
MHALVANLRRPSNRRGHNLLEVLIAASILSVVVILMAGVWALYHTALTKSKNMLVATSLARSVLEQKVAGGFSALDPVVASGVPEVSHYLSKSQVRGRTVNVDYTVTFRAANSMGDPGFRRLEVRLDWEEDTGKKNLLYETCLYKTP